MRVIDLEFSLPTSTDPHDCPAKNVGPKARSGTLGQLEIPTNYGYANYGTVFAGDSSEIAEELPELSLAERVAQSDAAGVEKSVILTTCNVCVQLAVQEHPGRFLPLAYISAHDVMRGSRELERLVTQEGFIGMRTSTMNDRLTASDKRYYPLYAKCVEMDIPVRLYSTMNYANDRRYDLGHPRYIDEVAIDFPELRIIAGLGGWPWTNEMVALMRRHPNLYCDTAGHRPRYLGVPGSGWEMMLRFGNTLLQDKVMVGLSSSLLRMTPAELVTEYGQLPLKDRVREKWLYANAARLFKL